MLQAFYTATVGAQQQMERMGVQGNNMANANTFGFRAEKPAFEALMYRMVDGIDGQQLPKGSGTRMVSTITDFRSRIPERFPTPGTAPSPCPRFSRQRRTEQRIRFTIWRMERAGRFWTPTAIPLW